MGSRTKEYVADPGDLRRPLNRTEVKDILASGGKRFAKDRKKVMHFVERVMLTLDEAARRQQSLDATNMDLKAQIAARTGYASSMDPELAVQYLPPDVLVRYANHAAQQMAEEADLARRRYEGRTAMLRERIITAMEQGSPETALLEELLRLLD